MPCVVDVDGGQVGGAVVAKARMRVVTGGGDLNGNRLVLVVGLGAVLVVEAPLQGGRFREGVADISARAGCWNDGSRGAGSDPNGTGPLVVTVGPVAVAVVDYWTDGGRGAGSAAVAVGIGAVVRLINGLFVVRPIVDLACFCGT